MVSVRVQILQDWHHAMHEACAMWQLPCVLHSKGYPLFVTVLSNPEPIELPGQSRAVMAGNVQVGVNIYHGLRSMDLPGMTCPHPTGYGLGSSDLPGIPVQTPNFLCCSFTGEVG